MLVSMHVEVLGELIVEINLPEATANTKKKKKTSYLKALAYTPTYTPIWTTFIKHEI